MKRVVVTALAASAIALFVFACDDGFDSSYGDGYGYSDPQCERHASCGTCTPVVGCGWCFTSDGQGTCTTSPDRCNGSSFGWTWEPTGCRVEATPDAGASTDGGEPVDAALPDAAPPDAPSAEDASADASAETAADTSADTSTDDASASN